MSPFTGLKTIVESRENINTVTFLQTIPAAVLKLKYYHAWALTDKLTRLVDVRAEQDWQSARPRVHVAAGLFFLSSKCVQTGNSVRPEHSRLDTLHPSCLTCPSSHCLTFIRPPVQTRYQLCFTSPAVSNCLHNYFYFVNLRNHCQLTPVPVVCPFFLMKNYFTKQY